jgi:hypothetical protein
MKISRAGRSRRPVIVIGPWAFKFARGAVGRRCNTYEAKPVPLDQRTTEADALPCVSHCIVVLTAHRGGRETNRRIRLSPRALRDLVADYRPGRPTGEEPDTLVARLFSAILPETRLSRTDADVSAVFSRSKLCQGEPRWRRVLGAFGGAGRGYRPRPHRLDRDRN